MNLKCLKIDYNGLRKFPHLAHLSKLTHIFAKNNKLTDYADVDKLKEIVCLKELELMHNSISRKNGYR